MKRILLATVAAGVLSLPAMAQQQQQEQTGTPSQEQLMPEPTNNLGTSGSATGTLDQQPAAGQAQQSASMISPSSLSEDQIKDIQRSLNQKGFDAGNVDGVWGPETQAAVRNFQEGENIQASGQLNHETLSALGVQVAGISDVPSTTGSGAGTTGPGAATTGSGAATTGAGGADTGAGVGSQSGEPGTTGSGAADSDPGAVSPGADENATGNGQPGTSPQSQ